MIGSKEVLLTYCALIYQKTYCALYIIQSAFAKEVIRYINSKREKGKENGFEGLIV